jgi:hypothetical protein
VVEFKESLFVTIVNSEKVAGFEILTAVAMKNTAVWAVTPSSTVEVHIRLGGTYFLHSCLTIAYRWSLA